MTKRQAYRLGVEILTNYSREGVVGTPGHIGYEPLEMPGTVVLVPDDRVEALGRMGTGGYSEWCTQGSDESTTLAEAEAKFGAGVEGGLVALVAKDQLAHAAIYLLTP